MTINRNKIRLTVVGLGYVGLPLAVEFSKKFSTIGFDLDTERVSELNNGYDRTNELSSIDLKQLKNFQITYEEKIIENSNIYIVTVPTPIDTNNKPNLIPIISATKMIARNLKKGDLVIYESTVFPGCTEQICVPILEKKSNLKYNSDFFCGYSPERINPGDKRHSLKKVTKVVSGSNEDILNFVNYLYSSIIQAGTFKASSIVVAEAAKVIENTQRDVNIALINELALIFDKLDISTSEVLEAASTKWNFLPFKPGLVGGHCIGVDPYYLTHKAIEVGYHPEMILAGRKINDNMGNYIAEKAVSELIKGDINPIGAKIAVLGLSFKENCPDLRNTKVISIIERLSSYNCEIIVSDPWVLPDEAKTEYGLELVELEKIENQDALIISVAHEQFANIKLNQWKNLLQANGVVIDVKSIYDKSFFTRMNFKYWKL